MRVLAPLVAAVALSSSFADASTCTQSIAQTYLGPSPSPTVLPAAQTCVAGAYDLLPGVKGTANQFPASQIGALFAQVTTLLEVPFIAQELTSSYMTAFSSFLQTATGYPSSYFPDCTASGQPLYNTTYQNFITEVNECFSGCPGQWNAACKGVVAAFGGTIDTTSGYPSVQYSISSPPTQYATFAAYPNLVMLNITTALTAWVLTNTLAPLVPPCLPSQCAAATLNICEGNIASIPTYVATAPFTTTVEVFLGFGKQAVADLNHWSSTTYSTTYALVVVGGLENAFSETAAAAQASLPLVYNCTTLLSTQFANIAAAPQMASTGAAATMAALLSAALM